MVSYSAQYQFFARDKHGFLTSDIDSTADARRWAEGGPDDKRRYKFLADNKTFIEQEFNQLYAALKKGAIANDGAGKKFWLYCYSCSIMLKNYYEIHDGEGKPNAKKFADFAEVIRKRCENVEDAKIGPKDEGFLKKLGEDIGASLKEMKATPFSISKIVSNVGFANVSRIYWTFCRLTMKNSLFLARELQWIEKLGNILGKEIDVEAIVHTWEKPNHIFRALSVGFFVGRMILNMGIALKHAIAPTSTDEEALTTWRRFTDELYDRRLTYLNDIVWATVNGLTNYNDYFGISNPVAGWATAAFLLFDVSLLLYRRELAKGAYLTKRAQYEEECIYHEQFPDQQEHAVALKILREQIKQLDNSWEIESSTYLFNATGALLLLMGFSASMLLTPAALIAGSYLVCTLGVAIYLSDGAYSNYKEKSVALRTAELENAGSKTIGLAQWEQKTASDNFYFTLGKNAVMPALFMTTMAISLPAALVMTATYMVYSLGSSYHKHNQDKATELSINSLDDTPRTFSFV
ncbi:hypothetical protein [Legionella feeleii]|uniref:Coiled-coil protein n=1 Tax=Legionella feeleii TaxID=453 RepID=A0A0W0TNU5_9GAMM|nr:hypothetical protein [Legionella feeleii]KTC96901.1 coiled-coil protein [Legionella feeleii]SPX60864.1 coiled-coil protein [Legionella feeleii]